MQTYKIRLKKGDTVIVRSGKYKGQTGVVQGTHPRENKVTVEGVNVVKKAVKPTISKPQSGIVEVTKPLWVSKVSILEPTTKKPSRVGYKTDSKGNKVRIYKRSGKEVKEAGK